MAAPAILWQPSKADIQKTQLWKFMQSKGFSDYNAFYDWSIQFPEIFWENVWQFCNIQSHRPYKTSFKPHNIFQKAQWFEGSTLNFAENLLSHRDEKTALVAYQENGQRQTYSYHTLYQKVAQLAHAMQCSGIKTGDRIAGFLPNLPETIICMLATTSLGAVWTACSPDFGVQSVIDRFEQIGPRLLFATTSQSYNGKTHDLMQKIESISESVGSIEKTIVFEMDSRLRGNDAKESENEVSEHKNRIKESESSTSKIISFESFTQNSLTQTEITFTPVPFNHPVYILYSSGTTGKPKCIVHGVGGTLLQHQKELRLHTDLNENDTLFYYTTCSWMMWHWMVSSLATGCTLVIYEGSPVWPNQAALIDLVEREKITVFGTSAKYIATLQKENLDFTQRNLSALRCILSTGSPLNPDNFDYVYQHIKSNLQLSSISGGTDIISCFALGNPILPVYKGQLQSRGLGMAVDVLNEAGNSVRLEKGELVCQHPFPSMPIGFWNDPDGSKYQAAYFTRFPNIWTHGDYAEITSENGLIIYGRSDAILNPGGVRIGTAEIYRQVEIIPEVLESVVVGQDFEDDVRIILFVRLRDGILLDEALIQKINQTLRQNASPRHVPAKIIKVSDIPRTFNGKIAELAVRNILHGLPIKNKEALLNPECLSEYTSDRV